MLDNESVQSIVERLDNSISDRKNYYDYGYEDAMYDNYGSEPELYVDSDGEIRCRGNTTSESEEYYSEDVLFSDFSDQELYDFTTSSIMQ